MDSVEREAQIAANEELKNDATNEEKAEALDEARVKAAMVAKDRAIKITNITKWLFFVEEPRLTKDELQIVSDAITRMASDVEPLYDKYVLNDGKDQTVSSPT